MGFGLRLGVMFEFDIVRPDGQAGFGCSIIDQASPPVLLNLHLAHRDQRDATVPG